MPLTERENYIRNARRTGPEYMPCQVHVSMASWDQWRGEMEKVALRHPTIFPSFRKGMYDFDNLPFAAHQRKGEPFRDSWGVLWKTDVNGLTGVAVEHPLDDWSKLKDWRPPDPMKDGKFGPVHWEKIRENVAAAKARGDLTSGGVDHGFILLRLADLRGFEALMLDFADRSPELRELIEIVDRYNRTVVDQYVDMGVDVMGLAEDLGAQTASLISPAMFREWCLPSYQRLTAPCREAGILALLHSDGYIMDLMDLFEEAGIDIVNPQDLCNGIDDLARVCKGRFCVRLDVDRQRIVPFGTRREIRDLIEEEVGKLGSPRGGLELLCGVYPPTPPENVDALCCAMEEFRTYWFDGHRAGTG